MTEHLAQAFRKEGFEIEMIDGPKGPPDDPERVDYEKLPTKNAVLHLWFETVGMFAGRLSSEYIPRVNATAYLLYAGNDDYLYNDTVYYGADSRGEQYWSIPHDPNPRYRFASAEVLVEKAADVAETYDFAIQKVAAHIAREIRKQYRPENAQTVAAGQNPQ